MRPDAPPARAGPSPRAGPGRARAAVRQARRLCRACGGGDGSCGGGDDATLADLGFASSCLDVDACGGAVTELAPAALCTECVARFGAGCAVQSAADAAAGYPDACKPATPPLQLDYARQPAFGSTSLASGFAPDPFTASATGGGPVNVGYLGGGCTGFASVEPSFSVGFGSSGGFSTLRFYVVGGGNTTLVVNTPSGNWACADDSCGTPSPTVELLAPESGRYDLWGGTCAAGIGIGGTHYVTESTGNHP